MVFLPTDGRAVQVECVIALGGETTPRRALGEYVFLYYFFSMDHRARYTRGSLMTRRLKSLS